MPDVNTVGSLALPIDAGDLNESLDDPTLLGLLAYLGHWIKLSLDDKLANQEGPTTAGVTPDACPVANRFPWDHGGAFMRPVPPATTAPLPGLWAFERDAAMREETLYWSVFDRTIVVQYIFPELVSPIGMGTRNGLMAAVAKTIAKAIERGREASYANGTPLFRALNVQSIDLVSCRQGRLEVIPGGTTAGTGRSNTSGTVHRFYPSVEAVLRVVERIGPDTALGIAREDDRFTIASGDAPNDGLDVLERIATPEDAPSED
jgi:hypothetical protein